MQKTVGFAALILLLALAMTAIGQTVIRDTAQSEVREAIPTRGMTMEYVEEKFGAPKQKRAPVGDPPITRWEYQGFIVYFEYKRVIHSVSKRPTRQ